MQRILKSELDSLHPNCEALPELKGILNKFQIVVEPKKTQGYHNALHEAHNGARSIFPYTTQADVIKKTHYIITIIIYQVKVPSKGEQVERKSCILGNVYLALQGKLKMSRISLFRTNFGMAVKVMFIEQRTGWQYSNLNLSLALQGMSNIFLFLE